MQSLISGIIALVVSLLLALQSLVMPASAPVVAPSAAIPHENLPATSTPEIIPEIISQNSPAPQSKQQKEEAVPLPPLTTALQPPAAAPVPSISPEELNTKARASLVNVLCTTRSGGYLNPITGSGVIIDPRGIILTPAHVAQYFLLRNYGVPDNVQCIIRTGDPAGALYTATLLYLPPAWIDENASELVASQALGTGEYDYAFLLITGRTNPLASLPASFPYLPLNWGNPKNGDQMLLASYPAGFLQAENITKNLYIASAYATVRQLYVFHDDTPWIELFSVPGTVLSQAGSSGGAAVRAHDGSLAGIIVTSTTASSTSDRDLRAITIAHIEHSLQSAGEGGILTLLSGDMAKKASDFNANVAPGLTKKLEQVLDGQ